MEKKEPVKSDIGAIAIVGIVCMAILVLLWIGTELSMTLVRIGVSEIIQPIALQAVFVVAGLTLQVFLIYGGVGIVMVVIGVLLKAFSPSKFERYGAFMVDKPHILFKRYREVIDQLRH